MVLGQVIGELVRLSEVDDLAVGTAHLHGGGREEAVELLALRDHPERRASSCRKPWRSATVDRLLHHAHVCVTGDSIRLQQATTGKGAKPLK
jgi:hypothetical protein